MASDFAGIKTSRVSPAFLHGNSTSHTWPFSAIAELIDNAYDPDVSASELWIDKRNISKVDCLTFVDNGNGMNQEKLYKMLSFGYCEKVTVGNVKPIGYYGNGFKSGSMRLGSDAMVFTRCLTSTSVGFLSQTYLKASNAEAVVVPIVTWDITPAGLTRKNNSESLTNLKAILKYSPFKTEKDLMAELKTLEKMRTGTNIIVFNLKQDNTENLELDFVSDPHDIRNPETPVIDLTSINRPIYTASPEYRRSLREYCSILYLKPRMKIVIRGQKVKTKLISKSLSQTEVDVYKPTWLNKPVKLIFGFTNDKEPDSYGLMMYHKNRLIRAYEKIGCQKQANDHGVGVIGVVEANFLDPIHNKQEFNKTDKYLAFMQNAANKLNDYFYEKTQCENPNAKSIPHTSSQLPDWTWAQCDNCLSWRRLPTGYSEKLPDKWYCYLNPDAHFNRCDIPEEPEDDDEALQTTYRKTYKKTQAEKNRQARLIEERKLKEKEENLKRKEEMLQKKMNEITRKQTELEEVSSSQDRVDSKPTVADLERAKKSLKIYQEKMAMQEKTIKQLEIQKQQIEHKSTAMLRMAESLRLTNVASKNLEEKVKDLTGTSNSTVSSSSHTLRPPHKRKSTSKDGSNEKVAKIKTEDGGFITVNAPDAGVVDLTLDEEEISTQMEVDSSVLSDSPVKSDKANKTNDKNTAKSTPSKGGKDSAKENSDSSSVTDKTATKSKNDTPAKTSAKSDSNPETDKTKSKDKASKSQVEKTGDKETLNDNSESKPDEKATEKSDKEGDVGDKKDSENTEVKEKEKEKQSGSTDYSEIQEDVKPDKEELDKNLNDTKTEDKKLDDTKLEDKKLDDNKLEDKKLTDPKTEDKKVNDNSEEKKVFVEKGAQTVPTVVKFASPEELDLLKLCPSEQRQVLLQKARELDETKKEFSETQKTLKSLQDNIWQLLKIIVPDFDYGNPENIEKIILDFIRVNGEQNDSPSTSGN
ncbi:MORC family CW-type zinc finger protein 3-like [Mercenaria mercenaria]|uniref:MORC family CW-type zinc finger protein 3-like n=1 Tax=Mercenaria mercenaria TaxID=6596 RepID=UPI00234E9F43|nr:MORC family CW-type zinc finger protein 3-like [Mercenaria mercenaria]